MTSARRAIKHPDAQTLAAGVAARLAVTIQDTLSEQDVAHVVVSGAPIVLAGLSALARQPLLHAVDFSRVHVWWAEDAFLPEGHPLRNETRARAVMQGVIAMPPTHVHSVPPAGPAFGVHDAIERYVEELAQQGDGGPLPAFDIVLLGVGPSGEVAALYPDSPQARVSDRMVTEVSGAPWDAPTRITLTLPALCSGRQVWLVAEGAASVDAVRTTWHGVPDSFACPASLARGQESTLLLADAAALAGLER